MSESDSIPIQVKATGYCLGRRVITGRHEWNTGHGGEQILRQEFLVEVPVAIEAAGGDGDSPVRTEVAVTESVWVELPIRFGAETDHEFLSAPAKGKAGCTFIMRRRLRLALPTVSESAVRC